MLASPYGVKAEYIHADSELFTDDAECVKSGMRFEMYGTVKPLKLYIVRGPISCAVREAMQCKRHIILQKIDACKMCLILKLFGAICIYTCEEGEPVSVFFLPF